MGPGCRCLAALVCILGYATAAVARTKPADDPFLESILGISTKRGTFDNGPDPVPRLLQEALADLNAAGDQNSPGEYYSPPADPLASAPAVAILSPGTAAASETTNPGGNTLRTYDIDQARAAALREKQAARQELGPAPQSTAGGESVNAGAVVGGVLGAVALVGVVVGAVLYSRKRDKAHRYRRYQNEDV